MSEWQQKRLSELVAFQKGKKVETSPYLKEGFLRYLGASGINGKDDGFASKAFAVLANKNDILMLWDGERAGLVGFNQEGVVASTVTKLTVNSLIDPCLLYHILNYNFEWIQNRRTGTGVPHVPKYLNRILCVDYPENKFHQRKIAAILTTVDTAIEKTEALIEKYQQIKAGLMHDLFTRGVLPNGKLRPPREQAPELYQETAVGWIPKEWGQPVTLESLLANVLHNFRCGPFGSALLKSELVENGIPFLGIDNIHIEKFHSNFKRFVSERKFQELSQYSVRPRDVVITIMGTVGRSCVIPDYIDQAMSSKHLWTMTFDTEKVIPELICWQLNHATWTKAWFRRGAQGGVMDAIQSKTLKYLKLPYPSIDEQQLIFERYQALNKILATETLNLEKLQMQKLGLMQDLLTGKVEVRI